MIDSLKIYEQTYIRESPHYHEEIPGYRDGEAGIPLQYHLTSDDYVVSGLCLCILLSLVAAARSWNFTVFQISTLFRTPREDSIELRETTHEMQYQLYFWMQEVFLMALLAYSVMHQYFGDDYIVNDYIQLGIFAVIILAYKILKSMLQIMVLPVYYRRSKRNYWRIVRTFLTAVEGALLLPVMLAHCLIPLDTTTTLICASALFAVVIFLRYLKAFNTFFKKNAAIMQFLLYLCTMEVVPLALLIGTLLFTANYIKINI